MTDYNFEAEGLLKVLDDHRTDVLRQLAKCQPDRLPFLQGTASGIDQSRVMVDEYFRKLFSHEAQS